MSIKVRYFATMRDKMGRAEETVEIDDDSMTVAELWKQVSSGDDIPASILVAVNMEYTDASASVKSGDEVAFFPPVTGG